ncbi:hypothetical protein GCM10011502_27790 [Oceanisphaera marina]|uniref:Uncharacterized protein n=1 Tax=Oceanisphaera marina TaxID=2017550 RepID=A0ABQ1IY50_9GAMM|nr:hypothetical protein [Oceanisphaera marina]GGB53051.1 hypothetical protein GCM10011502_27790 [Oceanisphaera marina]
MSKVTDHLVLVVNNGDISAWHLVAGKNPKNILIQGETSFSIKSAAEITSALLDIKDNIEGIGLSIDCYHWLADRHARRQLTDPRYLPDLFGERFDWQLVSLDWLAVRFGRKATDLSSHFIEQELLPWLITADDAAERQQMKNTLEFEHASESERLLNERIVMEQENRRLQEQNAALRQVDKERLVTYLPALFSRVFTILGTTDLALLCGSVEPLSIPNPYPEPSTEALRVLQRQFRSLPQSAQLEIVQLVQDLPHRQRLTVRPEMRELIYELEG